MNNTSARTVLFFDHTAKMGGGEIALLHLLEGLHRERYIPVVVLGADGPLHQKLVDAGIETHVLPLGEDVAHTRKDSLGRKSLLRFGVVWSTACYTWKLARFMRKRAPHLIHTNSLKADIIGGVAARLARIPVIWHVRDRIHEDYLPRVVVRVFRRLCRLIPNLVIVNSEATLKTLAAPASTGSGSSRVRNHVVHDGVPEPQEWNTTSVEAHSAGAQRVGLVGRISPWKGQHVFVRAASEVRQRFPEARFLVIGSAMFGEEDYEKEVKELATALKLDGSLEFTGFRPDVEELIQSLTVLVHASTTGEPFGQVIAEGMAAAKPIVATKGGAVPEIVQEGVTGLLVPMGDARGMAEAISQLLSDPDSAQKMGEAGRRRVCEQFTIKHVVQKVEKIYDDFLLHQN